MPHKITLTPATRCRKPDRDSPKLVCDYPLPCPYHTVIVKRDTSGAVVVIVPHDVILDADTRDFLLEIGVAIKYL